MDKNDVDDLGELESVPDSPDAPEELEELAPEEEKGDLALLEIPLIKMLKQSYEQLLMPLALLDDKLQFIFRNEAFESILRKFDYPNRSQFTALFYSNLGQEEINHLYYSLRSPEKRFCWKGRISHKLKHISTELTNVFIYPYFMEAVSSVKPVVYTVFFDDITEENLRMLRSMFNSLLEASKLKDNDTGDHIPRVNMYSRLLASKLYNDPRFPEVDQDFIDNIGFLAAMHDIGKIGTPDDILNKNGPLTPWEWNIMREHTINGAYFLSAYPNTMARQIAIAHHEMWDGNGYPYKLQGEMIPLAARIVSIADVYDALRMKRSYKPAYSHAVAVAKIREWSGSHFDPRLIECFLRVSTEFGSIFESTRQ
jgi:HD-GYP domain-containing protein (c-di-GMP phosphodiesterase class II)